MEALSRNFKVESGVNGRDIRELEKQAHNLETQY